MPPYVIIAPPQATCTLHMGQAWASQSPAAASVYREADEILGDSLGARPSDLVFKWCSSQATLNELLSRTDLSQIAVYMTSVACWRGLLDVRMFDRTDVIASAGLSFGEITCLTISGAIPFRDGLRLVVRRGKAMQAAQEATDGGCLCVGLTDEAELQDVVRNCRGSAVLSVMRTKNTTSLMTGSVEALERSIRYVKERFNVCAFRTSHSAAFHSRLLSAAVPEMEEAMKGMKMNEPDFPVVSCTLARPYTASNIPQMLLYSMPNRLDWLGTCAYIRGIAKSKGAKWLSLEPGQYMANDLRRMKPPCQNVSICDEP